MKKTALVLALGSAFAGAALAQSSVTLYGRINQSFDIDNYKGARNEQAVHNNSSRIGFRGVESIDGSTNTIFGVETALNADNGASGLGNTLRNAYVGLQGAGWGGFAVGRLDVSTPVRYGSAPLYAQFADVWSDVNQDNGVSNFTDTSGPIAQGTYAATAAGTASNSSRTFAIATRESNALAYASPNLGGFNFGLRYAQRGTEAQNGGNANSFNNAATGNNLEQDQKRLQLAGTYNKAGLVVGLGYEKANYRDSNVVGQQVANGGALTNFNLDNRWQFVAGYDLKVVKVGFIYARNGIVNADTNTAITTGRNDTTSIRNNRSKTNEWGVSLKAPFGAHEVLFNYGQADLADDSSAKRRQAQLGYGYNLSARTRLYAFYQNLTLSTNNNFGFTPTGATSFVGSPRINTFSVGIRHNF